MGSKEETYRYSLEISITLRGEEEMYCPKRIGVGGCRTRLEEFRGTGDNQLGFCPFLSIE